MALPAYMRFTYNNNELESDFTRCGEHNLFEILEYTHELGGKEQHNFSDTIEWVNYHTPVIATMVVNKYLPLFYELLCKSDSKYFDMIEMFWTRITQESHSEEVYLKHTLEPVKIRSIRLWLPNIKNTAKEHQILSAKIDFRYKFLSLLYPDGYLQTGPYEWPLFLYDNNKDALTITPQERDRLIKEETNGSETLEALKIVIAANQSGKIKTCLLNLFTVKNTHFKRNVVLDVLKGKPTRNGQYVLQVVSDYKKFDKVKIEVDGSCDFKPDECPQLIVNGEKKVKNQ